MTRSDSSVGLIFDDGSSLALGAKSIFVIKNFKVDHANKLYDVDLNLTQGTASFESRKIGKQLNFNAIIARINVL